MADRIGDILGAIVTLAIIATIVGSSKTADDIKALGNAFTNSIKAATGK